MILCAFSVVYNMDYECRNELGFNAVFHSKDDVAETRLRVKKIEVGKCRNL
jgi:hypothetical protein